MKVIDFNIKGFWNYQSWNYSQQICKKIAIKLNLKSNHSWTKVENTDIISSIKISNIHPSINKAKQDNEAVDMIDPNKFWKWISAP
jgi:hypothetical protein